MKYRVAIIGAGLIGRKRADSLKRFSNCKLVVTVDIERDRATKLAADYGGEAEVNWEKVVSRNDIDIVIVSTISNMSALITLEALKQGKHVLCEKPLGINSKESRRIVDASRKYNRLVKAGFNHRFHPAIMKAKSLCEKGFLGKPHFIRACYGHGGREGMEKEWRLNRTLAGGGELRDQGVHLIDLCRWFAGDFHEVAATCSTKFWKVDVEDNAFLILNNDETTASIHVSTTHWGNTFSFEIFGEQGMISIQGLGRRYGIETITFGQRELPFNELKTKTIRYPDIDHSWHKEWNNFLKAIQKKEDLSGSALDGLKANQIVDAAYISSIKKKVVKTSKR